MGRFAGQLSGDQMHISLLRSAKLPRAVACAAVAFATFGAGAGAASASGSDPMTAVPQGIKAQDLPNAKVFGNTPASTPETVSFVLKGRGLSTLESAVQHGTQAPLSVAAFTAAYGQTDGVVSALENYLGAYKITTTHTADNLDVTANGTAGNFDQALDIKQSEYHVPAQAGRDGMGGEPAQTVHGTTTAPELPASIGQDILGVFGITNYAPFVSQAAHVPASVARPNASSPSSCEQLSGLPDACNLPSDFASRYGLTGVSAQGHGQTIGIMTFAALDPGAPQYFWQNVEGLQPSGRTVTVNNIDGGPGAPSDAAGTGETDLDVEQSGGVAPAANVVVYQAPNSDAGGFDMLYTAASKNVAQTISQSWGESETYIQAAVASHAESAAYQAANDQGFLEMAAQGQSAFLSSGDAGAYDASADLGTTNLSVDNPANTPYATAAGGTTLPWSGTLTNSAGTRSVSVSVPAERAWGWDYLWQPTATLNDASLASTAESLVVGDGGGFSALEPQPSYQQGVSGTTSYTAVPYLTPTSYQNVNGITEPTAWNFTGNPGTTTATGSGRALPDLSTDADPYSGYLLYEPSASQAGAPALAGGWGGTSFVAPELNGSAAVIDSALGGRRVGLWNPVIYQSAAGKQSPFAQSRVSGTANDNIYYTATPGTVFNPAVGLGVPNLAKVESAFAARK
jgi:kumamolisin